jgi:hypothetical protein
VLKMTLNLCARYIYGISRHQHISIFTNKILGAPLDVYYSFRMSCLMYTPIKSDRLGYLFDELQFGRSRRLFNIIVPSLDEPRYHLIAQLGLRLFFVQGAILWQKSEEWVALVSSGKVVCRIYSVLRAVVVVIIMIIILVFNNNL